MGKRTAFEADASNVQFSNSSKRQRISGSKERNSPRPKDAAAQVNSAHDLRNALVFDQSSAHNVRSGLSVFKHFLDAILYSTEEHDIIRRRAILREYLDTQKSRSRDETEAHFLQNLIQAWDFAAETNAEAILSQVTAILALLFKVFTSHAELLDYGTLLAQAVLQPSVARRFIRNTSAAPNKENIIAPALRLLTQLTSFNDGAHARVVYARRDFTLEPKILGRNISLARDQGPEDHVRKPSIRTTAIRYLLTHLKYQDEHAKSEILANTNVVRALFDKLRTDPPFLISEIFDVLRNHVFLDKTIARHTKSRILNGKTLMRIASLYSHHATDVTLIEGQQLPTVIAHDFLRLVCTDTAHGILLPTNGLYPSASDKDEEIIDDTADFDEDFNMSLNMRPVKASKVRNVILSEFIQSLRPYANPLHQQLIVEIFQACPELVADYFHQRREFNYDPKLTATWIGYSAFLFETIQLAVPQFFGIKKSYRNVPPPASVLVQAILPEPLDQRVLTKCLNHESHLVKVLASRVLSVALQKLRSVVEKLESASSSRSSKRWQSAIQSVMTETSRRFPPIKTIFLALRKPEIGDLERESITRLLKLYYEVIPHVALHEKFDVSLLLCNALTEAEKATVPEDRALRVVELEYCIQMARLSHTMKWWQKPKTLDHSPFVRLLKLLVSAEEQARFASIKSLLLAISQDEDMLQTKTWPHALDALIASLRDSHSFLTVSNEVLDFLDDCCARFVKSRLKYFDDLDNMRAQERLTPSSNFSPLLLTLVEQWPFYGGNEKTSDTANALAHWISKLLYLLKLIGEDERILERIRDRFVEVSNGAYKDVFKDAFLWKMGKERAKESLKTTTGANFSGSERSTSSPDPLNERLRPIQKLAMEIDLEAPPKEDEKHVGLSRWRKKELNEAIEDGDVGSLLLCLCSEHAEIRFQAMSNIRQLMSSMQTFIHAPNKKVKEAKSGSQIPLTHELQHQYILLGEVLESLDSIGSEPFPYVGGILAARAVSVLADPTHSMFGTINQFLTIAPSWSIDSLLRTFWRLVVDSEPDNSSNYEKDVEWFLDYLLDALRRPNDMELFRRSNIFEQLLSHYSSRSCAPTAKDKILRLLLRATHVEGSTTLITRCGIMDWIQGMLVMQDPRQRKLRGLVQQLHETCDQKKIDAWSNGTMNETVALLTKDQIRKVPI